jgi:uridine phosphorylase
MPQADRPTTNNNLQYHTHTGDGDIAPLCLIVGAPGRADMIAERFFTDSKRFSNDYRGLVSQTGYYKGLRVSVVTSGMGGASMGIVLPEAVRSGARLFIRVGSCGSLIEKSKPGECIIVDSAIRYDGASNNWAPPGYPADADGRVVWALRKAASEVAPNAYYLGEECTTDCFYAGQGRPDIWGELPDWMRERHEWVMQSGSACYSMEAASLFVWCSAVGQGIPAGVINTIFANRHTNEWGVVGEERAAEIALKALVLLSTDFNTQSAMSRIQVPY